MRHLSLVPPLTEQPAAAPAAVAVPAQRMPYEDDPKVALGFFQAATGLCLCRECTKKRHPAYGAR